MTPSDGRDAELLARDLAAAFHGDEVEWRGFLTKAELILGRRSATLPSPVDNPITTEQLDVAQFGRVLHERPANNPSREELAVIAQDKMIGLSLDCENGEIIGTGPVSYAMADAILARLAANPPNDSMNEGLQRIINIDQRADKTTIEIDPAGNTYSIKMVDGPCAKIARSLLSPPSPGDRK